MNGRLRHFDGLRGLAALVVVLGHNLGAFTPAADAGPVPAWRAWLATWPIDLMPPANLSVCIFFLLSGYVLASSFANTRLGLPALVAKRYLRLAIPVIVVNILACLLLEAGAMRHLAAAAQTHARWLETHMRIAPDLLFAIKEGAYRTFLMGSTHYNQSLWTMKIEFYGSMVLILAFAGCRIPRWDAQTRRVRCGVALLLFALASHGSYLFLFGVGAAAFLFDIRRYTARWLAGPGRAAVCLAVGLWLGCLPAAETRPAFITAMVDMVPLSYSLPLGQLGGEPFWHACGAMILLFTIDARPGLRALFSRPVFQFLGDVSFPLYLIHIPVLLSAGCGTYLALHDMGVPENAAIGLAMTLSVAVAIAAAMVLTRYVETRAVRLSSAAGVQVQSVVNRLIPGQAAAGEPRPAQGPATE